MAANTCEYFVLLRNLPDYLLFWYENNRRSMPWREDPSPYHTWISEIMLQQTRVEAATDYYLRFIKELPDEKTLAGISDERLYKLWEGLGYYSRARNLKKAAQLVCERYDGRLPSDYGALLSLPGIGSYTAGAIASIAFELPFPAVDGNVLRVISRVTESPLDVADATVKKYWEREITAILPQKRIGDFNQSLMELGALICLPNGAPRCEICPLHTICLAALNGTTEFYPVKAQKKERALENRTVFLLRAGNKIALAKRPEKGLLAGMWEFPNETGHYNIDEIHTLFRDHPFQNIVSLKDAKHIFTHIEWHMKGFLLTFPECFNENQYRWVGLSELQEYYSLPSAFRAYRAYAEKILLQSAEGE